MNHDPPYRICPKCHRPWQAQQLLHLRPWPELGLVVGECQHGCGDSMTADVDEVPLDALADSGRFDVVATRDGWALCSAGDVVA